MARPYRRHRGGPTALLVLLDARSDGAGAVTVAEAARRIGTYRGFVYTAIRYGELRAFKVLDAGQWRIRIPAGELDRYVAEHQSQQAAS